MKKSFVVFGIGRFGGSVARTLYKMGHDVLAIDTNELLVDDISPYVTQAIQADAADENTVRSLGVGNMDAAIIGMGEDINASILVAVLCKELGVGMVIAKAQNGVHGKVLSKVGVDRVVYPEREMGIRIAQSLTSTNILEYIELSDEYSIAEIEALKEWEDRTIKDLNMRKNYGINIMAIKRENGIVNISPMGEDTIRNKDVLVVIGSMDDIHSLEHAVRTKK